MQTEYQVQASARFINHTLHRITMGVTNDLVQEVKGIGFESYVEQQLSPQSINDDETEAMVANFPRINMDSSALMEDRKKFWVRAELNAATLVRAVHSKRQLQEVMVDFWSNHFSVDTNKGRTAYFKVAEDKVFRQLALGKFSELLMASAKSPAMLEYLDNAQSRADWNNIPNENYARELMELHTLGVDGGYDEQDVVEASYVFSGWSFSNKYLFSFAKNRNKLGPLAVEGDILGWKPIAPDGSVENGESLLNFLAHHPQTARHICWKLCQRFVSDDITIDDRLVQRAAKIFLKHDTEIAPVLITILESNKFRRSKKTKVKRANELFYAILRATGATLDLSDITKFGNYCHYVLRNFGHVSFESGPPTGYPEIAEKYISAGSMINRWNLGLRLMNNKLSTCYYIDSQGLVDNPRRIVNLIGQLSKALLGKKLNKNSFEHAVLLEYLGKTNRSEVEETDLSQLPYLAAIIIGSASFQVK